MEDSDTSLPLSTLKKLEEYVAVYDLGDYHTD